MSMVQAQRLDLTRPYDPEANGNGSGGMIEVASSRAAQETQAAMAMAKRFPRDENRSFARIMQSCKRMSLAEQAIYSYPRGGSKVEGPSIRLAEAMAQAWGNIDFGIVELEQRHGESTMMSYAWDLETNTRQTRIFTVRHERRVGKGDNFRIDTLTDPRDIYEMGANTGARRLRACILGIIPGDVVDAAVGECEKTLKGNTKEPLADRARTMVVAFAEYSVTQDMIEARLGHKLDAISESELVQLRKVFASLRDGMADRDQFFQVNGGASPLSQKMKDHAEPQPAAGTSPAPAQAAAQTSGLPPDEATTTAPPPSPAPSRPAAGPVKAPEFRTVEKNATATGRAEPAHTQSAAPRATPERPAPPAAQDVDTSTSQIPAETPEEFSDAMWAIAQSKGSTREQFDGAMFRSIKAAKKKSISELTAFDRKIISENVNEARGTQWAYLQPEPPANN